MIELPVVRSSGRVTKPNCGVIQMTISSASRDRWPAQIEAAARLSSAKSRSETASSELPIGRSKPSSAAVMWRSMGKGDPARAAAPSGFSFIRARASANRAASRPNIST